MIKFKVYIKEGSKVVCLTSNFSDFNNFNELRKAIVNSTQKATHKSEHLNLKESDNFTLHIENHEEVGLSDIEEFFNSKSYNYFLEKLKFLPPQDKLTIKLSIKRVDKLPLFNPPRYVETLQKSLVDAFDEVKNTLKNELTEQKLNEAKIEFLRKKVECEPELKESLLKGKHINIICENCYSSNFYGLRYVCGECKNFNVCSDCYDYMCANHIHDNNHSWIQIKNPVFEDINKFSDIICPNYMYFDNEKTSFKVKITVVNNGEEDLQSCFIMPVRYGEEYLSCLKKTIIDNVKNGNKIDLEIMIKFPEGEEEGEFEGFFRLFTESGIPFGDTLKIKAVRINN